MANNNFYLALESGKREGAEKLAYDARAGTYIKQFPNTQGVHTATKKEEVEVADEPVPQSPTPATPSDTKKGNVSQTDTKAKADKKFIETESTTVTADIEVIPSDFTMGIKINSTVNVVGVGSNLSGPHLVTSITRKIDASSGLTISLGTKRTGFGETNASKSQKQAETKKASSSSGTASKNNTRPKEVDIVKKNSNGLKVGDKVTVTNNAPNWQVNYIKATGNAKMAAQLAPHRVYTISAISSDGAKVTLKETSETFLTAYIRKVQ